MKAVALVLLVLLSSDVVTEARNVSGQKVVSDGRAAAVRLRRGDPGDTP